MNEEAQRMVFIKSKALPLTRCHSRPVELIGDPVCSEVGTELAVCHAMAAVRRLVLQLAMCS